MLAVLVIVLFRDSPQPIEAPLLPDLSNYSIVWIPEPGVGGGGGGGGGGAATKAIIVAGVGSASKAIKGTMTAAPIRTTWATIDNGMVYHFRVPT